MPEGGKVALTIEYNNGTGKAYVAGYTIMEKNGFTKKEVRNMYMAEAMNYSKVEDNNHAKVESFFLESYCGKSENPEEKRMDESMTMVYGKYKPVALKVKPVYTELPDKYRKAGH